MWVGSPFTGRVSHPLDDEQSFMTSPHRHSPLTSLAWSHYATTPQNDIGLGVAVGQRAIHHGARVGGHDRQLPDRSHVDPSRLEHGTDIVFGGRRRRLMDDWAEDVEFATLTWVDWFNTQRLLEPIGYLPPAAYEAVYDQQAEVMALT